MGAQPTIPHHHGTIHLSWGNVHHRRRHRQPAPPGTGRPPGRRGPRVRGARSPSVPPCGDRKGSGSNFLPRTRAGTSAMRELSWSRSAGQPVAPGPSARRGRRLRSTNWLIQELGRGEAHGRGGAIFKALAHISRHDQPPSRPPPARFHDLGSGAANTAGNAPRSWNTPWTAAGPGSERPVC